MLKACDGQITKRKGFSSANWTREWLSKVNRVAISRYKIQTCAFRWSGYQLQSGWHTTSDVLIYARAHPRQEIVRFRNTSTEQAENCYCWNNNYQIRTGPESRWLYNFKGKLSLGVYRNNLFELRRIQITQITYSLLIQKWLDGQYPCKLLVYNETSQ